MEKFLDYHNEIWCDVIIIDVRYVILARLCYMIWTLPFMIDQIQVLSLLNVEISNLSACFQGLTIEIRHKGKIRKKNELT